MRWLAVVAVVAIWGRAAAQESLEVLPADKSAEHRKMLREFLLAEAGLKFDARREAVAALKTPADVEKRQKELRAKFVEALGGFPEKTPLGPRVVGKATGDGYRIEKVVYESRPKHHVSATLYLPDGKGPFPGVLMPIGHSNNGKAAEYIQRGAILLAKNGLAVLTYDPIGQGERRQLLDDKGKPVLPGSTTEHTMLGVGALLVGRSTASYRIWDGIRSLDYLTSRPEIDPKRIGCTGCSGGGTLTSYLMALDDRITVAAPSCYITSLERLFATIGPQDAEQNITGQVAFGMEHSDYLTMRAPRPTLICAATRDFFDIQGTWTSFREAKRVYGVMGHGERVDLFESDTTHGFPKSQREATLRWMRRWLLEKDDAPTEPAFAIRKDEELWCTAKGQVLEEFRGRSAFDLNAERALELARQRARDADKRDNAATFKEVARLIGVTLPVKASRAEPAGSLDRDGLHFTKHRFTTERGITVPGFLVNRKGAEVKGPLVVYLHESGKAHEAGPDGRIEKMAKSGQTILAIDPRGVGETAPGKAAEGRPNHFGVDFRETFMGLHLGRPLLGQRVHDVLAILAEMDRGEGFHLVAVGNMGPVALHAAALDSRVKEVTLMGPLVSWTAVATTPVSENQLTNVVPRALEVYDLPELAATLAPRPLMVVSPTGPTGTPLEAEAAREAYAGVKAAYARAKAENQFHLHTGKDGKR